MAATCLIRKIVDPVYVYKENNGHKTKAHQNIIKKKHKDHHIKKVTIVFLFNAVSVQISLKSVQTFELSHSHRNTQTHGLCALHKHVHLVGPTESQHSLLFYKSYTQHGTNVARERTHRIHRKRRHIWDF